MQFVRRLPYYAILAFIIYMPFHVFLSQSLSLVTGGLEIWKVAKDAMLALVTVFAICTVFWQKRGTPWYNTLLLLCSAYAGIHVLLWSVHPHLYIVTTLLGLAYNLRLVCFVVLGASAVLLYGKTFIFSSVIKLVLVVSTIVACLGVLQYFLPSDILTHLGYSLQRSVKPNFFIDDNPLFPRVMSTLRDPNSLGAYLILPFSILTCYIMRFRPKVTKRQALIVGCWLVHAAALYLTFSRSAWAGALVSVALIAWWQYKPLFFRILKRYWLIFGMATVLFAGVLFVALSYNNFVDAVLSHSTTAQTGKESTNQNHWIFVRNGLNGIADNPVGHGPGTAGLVSIQNPAKTMLTENYYVQIGYEVGIVGLTIFIWVQAWLYLRIRGWHNAWSVILLASFWGYVVMNMVLHTWSNEAVAAQWWALAGMAVAAASQTPPKKAQTPKLKGVGR